MDSEHHKIAMAVVDTGDSLWGQLKDDQPLILASATVVEIVLEAGRALYREYPATFETFAECIVDALEPVRKQEREE